MTPINLAILSLQMMGFDPFQIEELIQDSGLHDLGDVKDLDIRDIITELFADHLTRDVVDTAFGCMSPLQHTPHTPENSDMSAIGCMSPLQHTPHTPEHEGMTGVSRCMCLYNSSLIFKPQASLYKHIHRMHPVYVPLANWLAAGKEESGEIEAKDSIDNLAVRTEGFDAGNSDVRTEEFDAGTSDVGTEEFDTGTSDVRTEEFDAGNSDVRTEEFDTGTSDDVTGDDGDGDGDPDDDTEPTVKLVRKPTLPLFERITRIRFELFWNDPKTNKKKSPWTIKMAVQTCGLELMSDRQFHIDAFADFQIEKKAFNRSMRARVKNGTLSAITCQEVIDARAEAEDGVLIALVNRLDRGEFHSEGQFVILDVRDPSAPQITLSVDGQTIKVAQMHPIERSTNRQINRPHWFGYYDPLNFAAYQRDEKTSLTERQRVPIFNGDHPFIDDMTKMAQVVSDLQKEIAVLKLQMREMRNGDSRFDD